jgi:DNA-binding MarR family transcriptional regulator
MPAPVKSYMTRENRIASMRIGNACAPLYRLDRNMRMRCALMFLLVGKEEGLTAGELAERLGVRKTVASRYLSDLGVIDRYGKPGLGLITMVQRIYGDRRERRAYLTEHGEEVCRQIQVALTEAGPRKRF